MPKSAAHTQTLVLLDAHAILHRAYHALPDFTAPNGEPTGALYGVVTMVLKIIEDLKPDYLVACYDLPEPTYRHDAFDGYKAGRQKTDDALVQQIVRSRDLMAAFGIPIYEHVGFEADDMLGTIVEQLKTESGMRVIIASGDMDTLQLVDKQRVQVYTLKRGLNDTILYDEPAVRERFGFGPTLIPDYKGLRGDPSDNIPGIVGIGDKGATTLITNFGSLEQLYAKLKKTEQPFLDVGIKPRIVALLQENEEEAMFSKMLATIRRDAPITFTVPDTHWREAADTEAVLALFSELGFRTLASRIRTLFNITDSVSVEQLREGVADTAVQEASIMLWLLESDRTNASFDELIDYGRTYFETTDFAEITQQLTERLQADEQLWHIFTKIEKPLMPVIAKMNQAGITLDVAYLKTLSTQLHTELDALAKEIHQYAGSDFNINSPKQLGEVLFDTLELTPKNAKKTATGQRSTKESELEKMRDAHPIIPAILRYRELAKLTGTYIDALPVLVSDDGRLRSTLLQTGTTTGRMASKDPNLQNIPIRTEEGRAIRQAFVPEHGKTLVAIDYSQIELRIAAILSGDAALVEIFKNGEDVHAGVAARVFNVAAADVTKNMRRQAKVINFGILYGMGVNALRQNLGGETTRAEAQEFLNAYFNTFTRLAEYLEETKAYAREHGYTRTLLGRKRHFPGMQSTAPFIRAAAERMAINAPIQGTAADCMRLAMLRADAVLKERNDATMLLQVHDELVFEVVTEVLTEVVPQLVESLEGVLAAYETRDVPLVADVQVGDNWRELQPWSGA
jgi:DNA polymerase-1